jgi:hypothetical protein
LFHQFRQAKFDYGGSRFDFKLELIFATAQAALKVKFASKLP